MVRTDRKSGQNVTRDRTKVKEIERRSEEENARKSVMERKSRVERKSSEKRRT